MPTKSVFVIPASWRSFQRRARQHPCVYGSVYHVVSRWFGGAASRHPLQDWRDTGLPVIESPNGIILTVCCRSDRAGMAAAAWTLVRPRAATAVVRRRRNIVTFGIELVLENYPQDSHKLRKIKNPNDSNAVVPRYAIYMHYILPRKCITPGRHP